MKAKLSGEVSLTRRAGLNFSGIKRRHERCYPVGLKDILARYSLFNRTHVRTPPKVISKKSTV